ncbi:MAG: V-type ATP synthase subunit F [Thiocapsa sp.]|jgi:vacuolar-type H+-ATPase subunit F/Vma7|nr:V-type ATP synthase subunit F [Thiocapsa sp.]MCG6897033.1 V-type ATP synthase subunit F [Thiocapsa sp.]MCG6983754.1 V-type ATP synthase subunit F [Thiocapsa sp.]
MSVCAFLGDEVSGLGFRLAGAEVHQPRAHEVRELFARLCGEVQLIILTAEVAAALPQDLLQRVETERWPLVLVIPDVRNRVVPPDLVAVVRRHLGMAE